jgi:bifunctional UDP-N-acetylglucosamine pyrophosphorylase/glucosamine-1-phosphate N-acetyltransferase
MQAVILAAGEGTRMRPLTLTKPKPLIEIGGMPILEYVVRALPEEIDEIILVVRYLEEQIREFCGGEFLGRRIIYVTQGPEKGTAAALRCARPYITGRFLLTFADDLLLKGDIAQLLRYPYALLVSESDTPERFGVISLNPDGTLFSIVEKPERPETNLINTGVAVLDKKIFDYEPDVKNGEHYLTGMLSGLAQDHAVEIVKAGFWQPVGYPEHIPLAEAALSVFTRS